VSRRRSTFNSALLAAALCFGASAGAQTAADESQIKAAFVYNFLKFVVWPAAAFDALNSPFMVAIVGNGATADAASRFLSGQLLGDRQVLVRRMKEKQSLAGMHAVFVTERDPAKLRQILDSAGSAGVLSIGEGAEFAAQGGVIALLIESRRVRFDIDMDVAEAAGLQISSKLLALTRVVHSTAAASGGRP